ncbi:MAG: helix-turn-helix domain-containing protein [Pseudonocardiaceae bacterium]
MSATDKNLAQADLPALIPIPTAARLLGLSRASAYRYAASGELPTKRFGRRVYVITNEIRSLLAVEPAHRASDPSSAA